MKKHSSKLAALAAVACSAALALALCGCYGGATPKAENDAEALVDLVGDWTFTSGVGGWATNMTINEDGTFTGYYSDEDYESGEGYETVLYECSFNGEVGYAKRQDDGTVFFEITYLEYDKPGAESVVDGVKHVAVEPYGLAAGDEFVEYLAEMSADGLDEDCAGWAEGTYGVIADGGFANPLLHNTSQHYPWALDTNVG